MKLEEYLEKFIEEINSRLIEDRKKLNEAYEKSKESYIEKCKVCILELIQIGKEKQELGQKDVVDCVGVHFLRTSVRTRSYEYKIALYNEELFLDRQEVAVYWSPPYFKEVAEEAEKYFTTLLRKECIRVSDYDIKQVCEEYLVRLMMQEVPTEIMESIENLCKEDIIWKLDNKEEIVIYKGEYLLMQEIMKTEVCPNKRGVV